MYAINNETQAGNGGGLAGIQENFELVNVEFAGTAKDGGGTKAIRFTFKKGNNFVFTHNEYPIDEARVATWARADRKTKVELTKEEKVKAAYADQAARIKHILTKFVPEDKINLSGSTMEEFSAAIIKCLGNSYVGVKVRLKLVFNTKDYLSFPKMNFIELMSVPASSSRLKIDPQYDRITQHPKDAETTSTPKAAAGTGSDF